MVVSSGRVRGSGSGKGSGADSSGRCSGNGSGNGDGIDSSHGSSRRRNNQLIHFLYLREVYYSLPSLSGEASKGVALESNISVGF